LRRRTQALQAVKLSCGFPPRRWHQTRERSAGGAAQIHRSVDERDGIQRWRAVHHVDPRGRRRSGTRDWSIHHLSRSLPMARSAASILN